MTIFERALELVADGMTVGLGTGRAAERFIEALGARVKAGLKIRGVPTSEAAAAAAARHGVPPATLAEGMPLDLTIDGADEVDPKLNVIKGYGRALLREKIVAAASRQLVLLVGTEKLVPTLGSRGKLPIEVTPFAVPLVLRELHRLGLPGTPYLVEGKPGVTDNQNYIIDAAVGPISDPLALQRELKSIPGVVETGMFLNLASAVLVGEADTFILRQELRRPSGSTT
jgi:ribose 5-phosphate isomerase A